MFFVFHGYYATFCSVLYIKAFLYINSLSVFDREFSVLTKLKSYSR